MLGKQFSQIKTVNLRINKKNFELLRVSLKDEYGFEFQKFGESTVNSCKSQKIELQDGERILGMKYSLVAQDPKRKKDVQLIIGWVE